MEWISVKTKLPDRCPGEEGAMWHFSNSVLIFEHATKDQYVACLWFREGGPYMWEVSDDVKFNLDEISHWKPLDAPPEDTHVD
jgi:hypothetical protein